MQRQQDAAGAAEVQRQQDAVRAAAEQRSRELAGRESQAVTGRMHSPGERVVINVKGVAVAFHWIPDGMAMIGSPPGEWCNGVGESQFEARFSRGFWMQETEVTQELYLAVMGRNPSKFTGDVRRPVENVSWRDARAFMEVLNRLVPGGGFRLPREAEWEYAARAGGREPFGFATPDYNKANCSGTVPSLDGFAWYYVNAGGTTHPVGAKQANAWGLYDMHGNVMEWCEDWYGPYPESSARDWTGSQKGKSRVLRGGCWSSSASSTSAAARYRQHPSNRFNIFGFRCARDAS